MLWQKLRNVFLATQKFRYGLRRRSSAVASSDVSSDFDTSSHASMDSSTQVLSNEKTFPEKQTPVLGRAETTDGGMVSGVEGKSKLSLLGGDAHEEECKSTGRFVCWGCRAMVAFKGPKSVCWIWNCMYLSEVMVCVPVVGSGNFCFSYPNSNHTKQR